MDSASSAYPESTPNTLHRARVIGRMTIQLFKTHSQYPLSLLLPLLLRRSFCSTNILREESLSHLYNNDVFRRENFFNKVVICQCLTGITYRLSLPTHGNSPHRREGCRCYGLNKDNVHICITFLKQRWRDTVRLLSKEIKRRTHIITQGSLKRRDFYQPTEVSFLCHQLAYMLQKNHQTMYPVPFLARR